MAKVSAQDIKSLVCAHYGVTKARIEGADSGREATKARHVAFYLTRTYCQSLSYPAIGRLYGGRDHTTVMMGVRRINPKVQDVQELVGMVVALGSGCKKISSELVKRSIQAQRICIQIALLADELSRIEAGLEMEKRHETR